MIYHYHHYYYAVNTSHILILNPPIFLLYASLLSVLDSNPRQSQGPPKICPRVPSGKAIAPPPLKPVAVASIGSQGAGPFEDAHDLRSRCLDPLRRLLLLSGRDGPIVERLIRRNGQVVGRAVLEQHRDYIYLHWIAVEPEWRGRGIGSTLMNRIVREFPQMQLAAVPLRLQGSTHTKQQLRRWYEGFGFRLVDDTYSLMVRP